MASMEAPMSFTLYRSKTPAFARSTARLSAVWPPTVGRFGVGHDGGRIAVDQHDLESLGAQGFAGLRPRIVELAGLTDDNRARANHQDTLQICSTGHRLALSSLV